MFRAEIPIVVVRYMYDVIWCHYHVWSFCLLLCSSGWVRLKITALTFSSRSEASTGTLPLQDVWVCHRNGAPQIISFITLALFPYVSMALWSLPLNFPTEPWNRSWPEAPIIVCVWGQHVPDAGRSLRSCQCKTVSWIARWAVFKIPLDDEFGDFFLPNIYWGLK